MQLSAGRDCFGQCAALAVRRVLSSDQPGLQLDHGTCHSIFSRPFGKTKTVIMRQEIVGLVWRTLGGPRTEVSKHRALVHAEAVSCRATFHIGEEMQMSCSYQGFIGLALWNGRPARARGTIPFEWTRARLQVSYLLLLLSLDDRVVMIPMLLRAKPVRHVPRITAVFHGVSTV
jgi:hypothetical protein